MSARAKLTLSMRNVFCIKEFIVVCPESHRQPESTLYGLHGSSNPLELSAANWNVYY